MNYGKLDAGLAAAVEAYRDVDAPDLPVFVELESPDDPVAAEGLARLGLPAGKARGGVRTATVSAAQVEALSDQPWVRRLRLARRVGLTEGPPPA